MMDPGDARPLAAAKSLARLEVLPDVNHARKQVRPDDRSENLAIYLDPTRSRRSGSTTASSRVVHAEAGAR